jgi:hypothetical protein
MRRDDSGLEVEAIFSLDGFFGCFSLVAARKRHQRLILIFLIRLQPEWVHF